jgi:hypothetical protein
MENRTPVFRGQKMVERVGDLGDRILKTENWKREAGSRKLETGNWKLETGNWKLETGNWKHNTEYRIQDSENRKLNLGN